MGWQGCHLDKNGGIEDMHFVQRTKKQPVMCFPGPADDCQIKQHSLAVGSVLIIHVLASCPSGKGKGELPRYCRE